MYAKLISAGLFGMNAYLVDVEIDLMRGMPGFDIVGLPDAAVKESRDRVRAAMKNCGYEVPVKKITVNLAPADLKKAGPMYDLPIFLALLAASGQTQADFSGSMFIGEVALDGTIRRVQGVLPMVIEAKAAGLKRVFVPAENGREGSAVQGIEVYPVHKVQDVVDFLENLRPLFPAEPIHFEPPGSGKSMLAKRLPSILPDMTFEEAIETTKIHSIAGLLTEDEPIVTVRPFRAPHHTVSPAGLSGGGTIPKPGEISLAHNGVLFLDELPEFSRPAMEILRQPIEEGMVTISRVNGTLSYPCNMMVIAAMNPCPCGYFGHPTRSCSCSPFKVSQYLNKVSGPLLDRLDLHIEVAPVEFQHLSAGKKAEASSSIKKRVDGARKIQTKRYEKTSILCNANLTPHMLREFCQVSEQGMKALKNAFEKMGMSARGYDRILKVARTIADLDGSEIIELPHISEALQYRSLDRKYWQHGK